MQPRVRSKVRQYGRMVAGGNIRPVFDGISRWTWSHDRAVGMERDLTMPFEAPTARVPIEVAKLDDSLAKRLFSDQGLDPSATLDMESRRRFWQDGVPGAHVAIDDQGVPCFVQWAISGEHADFVKSYFGDGFPELRPNELLLEGAWARPEARGKRIMAEAMDRITITGASPGQRRAITFVGIENEASIRGCRSAGYEVYIERQETWRFGNRHVTWFPPDTPGPTEGAGLR